MSIFNLSYDSLEGEKINLSTYKGKTIIIVNTASKCGFTPQYEGLEELYKRYKDDGLVVIGFPCNQFNDQEPGDSAEIEEFCKIRYGVTFPLAAKSDVRGENINEVFRYLTENTSFEGLGKGIKNKALNLMLKKKYGSSYSDSSIKWNFTKFLISKEGEIVGRFESPITPEEMEEKVKEYL